MPNTWFDKKDLQAVAADNWLETAKSSTKQWLDSLGYQPHQEEPKPALDFAMPTAEEFHASAPWRDLDPPKQTPTPSGTPAGMPSNAPRTGGIDSTITTGDQSPALRPGESVGSVSFGPPSGPPAEGVLRWSSDVDEASRAYGVPREVILGIMEIESGGNPDARSSQGAMGLMQVMPFHYGQGENGMDPKTSIHRGAKILADNYKRYGDWDRAAAAYFGAIDENGNITDASDATGTVGSKYVQLFRGAASKYGGGAASPSAAASAPASAPVRPTPSSAAGAAPMPTSTPAQPHTGTKLRVRDEWGNEFEISQDDLNKRPAGGGKLTVIGPVALNAGALSSPDASAAPQAAGTVPPSAGGLHPNLAQAFKAANGRDPSPEEAQELRQAFGMMA
jgi:hypothetical protein